MNGRVGRTKGREIAGLRLWEEAYGAGFHIRRHEHEHARLYLVLAGISTEDYGKGVRECQPLSLMFHPADEVHSATQHTPGRCFQIDLTPPWLERARECHAVLDRPAVFRGNRLVGLAVRLFDEFHAEDSASALAMEGLMLEILAEVSRHSTAVTEGRIPRWLVDARELLHAQFAENLSLEEIAQSVGVHPVHLARAFRRHVGCTVGEYIRRLRLNWATRELCTSGASLLEIALNAGFYDQSHFSRALKAQTGMTPTEFRERSRSR